jgi:hypothetical protein
MANEGDDRSDLTRVEGIGKRWHRFVATLDQDGERSRCRSRAVIRLGGGGSFRAPSAPTPSPYAPWHDAHVRS